MKQLLPYEMAFAENQDSIGLVSNYPFVLEINDLTPIQHKAIAYSAPARTWLREQCNILEKKGVIKRIRVGDQEPLFVSSVVLVKEG